MSTGDEGYLEGQLLIAMPTMGDPRSSLISVRIDTPGISVG